MIANTHSYHDMGASVISTGLRSPAPGPALLPGCSAQPVALVVGSGQGVEGPVELETLDGVHGVLQEALHGERRGKVGRVQREALLGQPAHVTVSASSCRSKAPFSAPASSGDRPAR